MLTGKQPVRRRGHLGHPRECLEGESRLERDSSFRASGRSGMLVRKCLESDRRTSESPTSRSRRSSSMTRCRRGPRPDRHAGTAAWRDRVGVAALVVLIVAAGLGTVARWNTPKPPRPFASRCPACRITSLAAPSGFDRGSAISPDGTRIVYTRRNGQIIRSCPGSA